MCLNNRFIFNPYIRRRVYVTCGHCPECQQEKAVRRSNRIRNNASFGNTCLFVTLTYAPDFLPFVFKEDLYKQEHYVPVYRDYSVKRFKNSHADGFVRKENNSPIGYLTLGDDFYSNIDYVNSLKFVPEPRGFEQRNSFGVIFYKDLQDFHKRLYMNLKRSHYDYKAYTTYNCAEIGPTTYRPHYHLLIFCPASATQTYIDEIVKSWPYADSSRTRRNIEVARNCASYVSSYVNRPAGFPKIFESNPFKQKHSYSQGFGKFLDCFLLGKILQKVDRGNCTYSIERVVNGQREIFDIPIPSYVINRYFPKFKGFSRLDGDTLDVVLRCPTKLQFCSYAKTGTSLGVTSDEVHKISVSLRNAYERCNKEIPMTYELWCQWYKRVWSCRASSVLRCFYESQKREQIPWNEMYDNINNAILKPYKYPSLYGMLPKDTVNPNMFLNRVRRNRIMVDVFNRSVKQRKVINTALSIIDKFNN